MLAGLPAAWPSAAPPTTACVARRGRAPSSRGRGFAPARSSTTTGVVTREGAELRDGIAGFYDASTPVWDDVWGEHLHHGYYPGGKSRKDHQQAQSRSGADTRAVKVDMVDNVLAWAGATAAADVLDVGCGVGGSTRHLARKFGARGTGITLSPVQVGIANQRTAQAGLVGVRFSVADALHMPFPDASFDLVWSLESGEHMPDKAVFMREMARVAKPGGRIILVTWCVRELAPGEEYSAAENKLLERLCAAYYLPQWCSIGRYQSLAAELGLQGVRTADWSNEVRPFWRAVIDTVFSIKGITGLLKSGLKTIRGALVMPLMQQGLRTGLIKFNLLTCTKPLA